ncbi:hypothetical protein [Bacillus sp. T33-2]|uniref:hypothetical protein n=1 Tax=Bacillus sp. T33-2 TaxID=2054168 RepID=UPI000C780C3C|nr:hypothetical protein [Bacillus sp. T33-2]PLR98857.1 hypothetical protein CVD19_04280 [Bacillus sp. T33-2]
MSEYTCFKLSVVDNNASIETIFSRLVHGCWVDEIQRTSILDGNRIIFTGGEYDSEFQITLNGPYLIIQSDSPWEMELICEELKDICQNKQPVAGIK